MKFQLMEELKLWLWANKMYNFAGGSQGECYKIGNKVYKIFIQYIDEDPYYLFEYSKEDILRFSHIENGTYVWPKDVITVGNIIVGYMMDYVKAKSLFEIDPLTISLNKLESCLNKTMKDIKIISDNGVSTYDVCYNIMYGLNGFKIIDTMEYSCSNIDKAKLFRHNSDMFSYEVKLFLSDGYFDKIVNESTLLYDMYRSKDVSALEFLIEFRKRLSEIEDRKIIRLGDAKKSIKKMKTPKYIRCLDNFKQM